MNSNEKKEYFSIRGMTCKACEKKIETTLKKNEGILKFKIVYEKNYLEVDFDKNILTSKEIQKIIKKIGYDAEICNKEDFEIKKIDYKKVSLVIICLIFMYTIINFLSSFGVTDYFPQVEEGMSYIAVFVIGVLTSVHCVGMCGGICLSQCVSPTTESKFYSRVKPAFLYNLGRVLSYTIIGGIVGAVGSVISFNGVMRGAVALFAGIFMVIMGLNMLELFPFLKRFNFRLPRWISGNDENEKHTPFYVGLLNGFMPCGPLQAMQLFALSTSSLTGGALAMFLFALGTTPLMFGFGTLTAYLTKNTTKKITLFSAVLVIILGIGMFNTGISMSSFLALDTKVAEISDLIIDIQDGYQIVKIDVASRYYEPIVVKKGIPVKFNLNVEDNSVLNSCNDTIVIKEYGIKQPLSLGDNIVEFLPTETGTVPYSCWMNMIRSSITIIE